jgi:hypothetical protein
MTCCLAQNQVSSHDKENQYVSPLPSLAHETIGSPFMVNRPPRYPSYLLRLWPVHVHEGTIWRASLVHVQTGEILGFATLEQLQAFLAAQTAALAEGQRTQLRNHPGKAGAEGNLGER